MEVYDDEVPMHALEESRFTKQKKAQMSKSKFKTVMIVFFDIWGIVHIDCLLEDQTVNQVYKEVLTILREWVKKIWNMEERNEYGFFAKTTPTQYVVCQDIFGEAQDPRVGTCIVLT